MAITRGVFRSFDPDIENTSEFINMMEREFPDVYKRMMLHGRRNISISHCCTNRELKVCWHKHHQGLNQYFYYLTIGEEK